MTLEISTRSSTYAHSATRRKPRWPERAEALWADPDDEDAKPEWFPCTFVSYRPRAKKYKFVIQIHFDDGVPEKISMLNEDGTPDASIRLLTERVQYCCCQRCVCYGDSGQELPIRSD